MSQINQLLTLFAGIFMGVQLFVAVLWNIYVYARPQRRRTSIWVGLIAVLQTFLFMLMLSILGAQAHGFSLIDATPVIGMALVAGLLYWLFNLGDGITFIVDLIIKVSRVALKPITG